MTNHLNKLPIRIRDKYEHLPEELRVEVARQFARHLRACAKCGFQADPMFLIEAISEADAGREVALSA